jgi:hypothetical protein
VEVLGGGGGFFWVFFFFFFVFFFFFFFFFTFELSYLYAFGLGFISTPIYLRLNSLSSSLLFFDYFFNILKTFASWSFSYKKIVLMVSLSI